MSGTVAGKTGSIPAPAPGEEGDPRPRRIARRSEAGEFSQVLDRLRDALLQRLETLEALAADQVALLEQDSSEREQALRERVALLEATQSRLQAEAKRRQQEWESVLEDLETDRRLLAQAWDAIERERIGGQTLPAPRTEAAGRGPDPGPTTIPDIPVKDPGASRAPVESDDHVTRSILWQFRTLTNDVRRNNKRRSGR
jgi:hypothetical protein